MQKLLMMANFLACRSGADLIQFFSMVRTPDQALHRQAQLATRRLQEPTGIMVLTVPQRRWQQPWCPSTMTLLQTLVSTCSFQQRAFVHHCTATLWTTKPPVHLNRQL